MRLEGANFTSLNTLYITNGTKLSNRPLYVSIDAEHGVWFTGNFWVFGKLNDLNRGLLTRGYLVNNEADYCPDSSVQWKEASDNARFILRQQLWSTNDDIDITCNGMLIVSPFSFCFLG